MTIFASLNLTELLGGFFLSAVVGVIGYRRQSLTSSGVLGAMITGTALFGLGGWEYGLLLLAFFISSSALSHYRADDKAPLAEKFAKGYRRDLGQALANAGAPVGLVVVGLFWSHPLVYVACAGAMAAVNADTWATEIGALSTRLPRLITTGRRVEPGTSGGVTGLGFTASLGGAGFIGLVGGVASLIAGDGLSLVGAVIAGAVVGGMAGSLLDSLLGSTVQAIYWCDRCEKETERKQHRCGIPTRRVRGLPWLGNDGVNFLASVVGAAIASAIGWLVLGYFG